MENINKEKKGAASTGMYSMYIFTMGLQGETYCTIQQLYMLYLYM